MLAPGDPLAPWETVERELVADGSPWLRLWRETVRLPDGRVVTGYLTLDQPDYAVVFPVASDGRVLALWHYKHGPRRLTLGFPAGHVEQGETPEAAARRELMEETGCAAARWAPLGTFSVDGNRGAGRAHAFLAEDLRQVRDPVGGDLEAYRLEPMEPARVAAHLRAGDVRTLGAAAAAALGLLALAARDRGTVPGGTP